MRNTSLISFGLNITKSCNTLYTEGLHTLQCCEGVCVNCEENNLQHSSESNHAEFKKESKFTGVLTRIF
jgi:hypothetical protein